MRRQSRRGRRSRPIGIRLPDGRRLSPSATRALGCVVGLGALLWLGSHLDSSAIAMLSLAAIAALMAVVAGILAKRRARVRARNALVERQRGVESLAELTWAEFETLVEELFRRQGYAVTPRSQGGADGGVDLILRRGNTTVLVQCKHWRTTSVGAPIVREMMGLIPHHSATSGSVVCTGKFTRQAIEFAKDKPIELVNGEALWR